MMAGASGIAAARLRRRSHTFMAALPGSSRTGRTGASAARSAG
jgi:hypothetical protein